MIITEAFQNVGFMEQAGTERRFYSSLSGFRLVNIILRKADRSARALRIQNLRPGAPGAAVHTTDPGAARE